MRCIVSAQRWFPGHRYGASGITDHVDEHTSARGDHGSSVLCRYPWFIYIVGGAGFAVFITASVGILSADCAACGVTCFLGLYHALMVFLLLIQIAAVCFYFFDKSWEDDLPDDTTGTCTDTLST